MTDMLAFLRARLDEDEAAAQAAASVAGPDWWRDAQYLRSKSGAYLADAGSVDDEELAPFWARHDPARVLREVQAKRAILELHGDPPTCSVCHAGGWDWEPEVWPCPTLRALASVYSDHADYGPTWGMSGLVAFLRERWGSSSGIRVQAETVLQAFGETSAEALVGRSIPVPIGSRLKEFSIREYLFQEDGFVIVSPGH